MKYKKLSQEDDLTLFRAYENFGGCPSIREICFFSFMIILYYSGYTRWFFWTLLILCIISFIFKLFDGLPLYSNILKKELKRRGYKNNGR